MANGWDDRIPYGPERKPWKDTVSRFAKDPTNGEYLIQPPSKDPLCTYPNVVGKWEPLFQVPTVGLSHSQIKEANAKAVEKNKHFHKNFLGYQNNCFFDYSHLKDFLTMHTNNIGDPFAESLLQMNTRWVERNVLDYYASLWNIRWPHGWEEEDEESYWGYCLTMGSTEGNMYGLWNARDYVTGKALMIDDSSPEEGARHTSPSCYMVQTELLSEDAVKRRNAEIPVVFYSEDAHYSLTKTIQLEGIKNFYQIGTEMYPDRCPLEEGKGRWPHEVPSKGGAAGAGEVDEAALTKLVGFFAREGHPVIVVFNYGSTFKGAYDNVENAGQMIVDEIRAQSEDGEVENVFEAKNDHGEIVATFRRLKYWIHVDGALGAAFMPFLEMARVNGRTDLRAPAFDFRLPFVCSIVTSGHKWLGAPFPCGVFMTRSKLVLKPPSNPDYVGSADTTFAGSRNALSPLILWNYITTHSCEEQVEAVVRCFELTQFVHDELARLGEELGEDLWVARSPLSLSVRFRKPNDAIMEKYSLGSENLVMDDRTKRTYAHLFVMQTTSEKQIVDLLERLRADPDPFPLQSSDRLAPAPKGAKPSRRLMAWPTMGRGFY